MKTLKSKKYVNETFCWQWYYFTVTKEGVKFLSQYLGRGTISNFIGVSENVLPKIFKNPPRKPGEEGEQREERRGGYGPVIYNITSL